MDSIVAVANGPSSIFDAIHGFQFGIGGTH